MRKVKLRMNELEKYKVIKKLVETNGNKQRAALTLELSIRQINRLIAGYKAYGKAFFIHGNRGRKPAHALTFEEKQEIADIYNSKYFDCTYTNFTEYLNENENIQISIDEVRNILKENYILSPKSHKSTKRAMKRELEQKLKKAKTKKEQENLQRNIVDISEAHSRQPRCIYFGEEVQMDASEHIWFGNVKTHLHAAIDDSTGHVLGAYFDKQETLNGYYHVTAQILENYGIPALIKADRRTVFEYKKKGIISDENDTFTQYSYAAKQLGIKIDTSSVPEFKARIERLFGTLQNRLNVALRLENITTIEAANAFLPKFLAKYNAQFALPIDNTKNVFEKQISKEKINLTLAVLTRRVVDSGHCIQFKHKYYKFVNSQGSQIHFARHTKCMVIEAFDKSLFATVDEEIYALKEIPKFQESSQIFDTPKAVNTEPEYIYIPKMIHPWKGKSFEKFLERQALKS